MADSGYRPGGQSAVVTAHAALLTDLDVPDDVLDAFWDHARAGADAHTLIDVVTGGRQEDLPAFALAVHEDGLLRVVARPGVTLAVGDLRGPHQLIARGAATTWISELVPVPQVLWMGPASDAGRLLALEAGVVRADVVAWVTGPPAEPPAEPFAEPFDEPFDEAFDDLVEPAHPSQTAFNALLEPNPLYGAEQTVPQPSPRSRETARAVAVPEPAPLPAGRLRFSTGLVVEVDGPLRIGRSPSADDPDPARPVVVDNPTREVSRNHAEVRRYGAEVVLVDLGSANGTVVTLPGGPPVHLAPHVPYPLVPGCVVSFAADLHAVYEGD